MNFPISQIRRQWTRVVENGWLPFFQEAAEQFGFEVKDLLAVGSRESNLDPKYLTVPGDRGNAFGLFQIDKRYFPEWVKTGKWKDARESILKGAEVLAQKRNSIVEREGQKLAVWNRLKTIRKAFVMPSFDDKTLRQVVIASYNCGDWASYHASAGHSIDQGTTGADYSADVLDRAEKFQRFIDSEPAFQKTTPDTSSPEKASLQISEPETPAAQTSEPPVTANDFAPVTPAVPGLKACAVSFGKKLFGSWKKISTWLAAFGITFNGDMVKPALVITVLIVLIVWFVAHTRNARKKARQ